MTKTTSSPTPQNQVVVFCQMANISEQQFYGKEPIIGNLYLDSLTTIPEGFNPTVGGDLYLDSLTTIPEGFNKESFRKKLNLLEWKKGEQTYLLVDGIMGELISSRNQVMLCKKIGKSEQFYVVTDGNGKYAHGKTIKEAKDDLLYKISNRDKSEYKNLNINDKMPFEKAIEMYRVITGACGLGVKDFVESTGIKKQPYSPIEIAKLTKGRYGNGSFCDFFGIN